MSKRAVLYARVSGNDRGKGNLASQIADCQGYATKQGYYVVAELQEDDRGASGYALDLPGINEALDMAEAGEFDILVVRDIDRFARNAGKFVIFEEMLNKSGVRIEYVFEHYDDSPEGRLLKTVRAGIAEYERAKITWRMQRGRRKWVKGGRIMLHGNHAPYGYQAKEKRDELGNITAKWLEISEPEARIVRLIFTWYVYGDDGKRLSIRAIAKKLTGMGAPTWSDRDNAGGFGELKRRGWGEWSHSAVADILANEVYTGVWHYSKKGNSHDYWLAVEVPVIVSREVWEKVQERRKRNKELAKRNTKHEYLIGRRVVCGHCGSKMAGKPATPWKGKKYFYYYCPAKAGNIASRKCNTKYFNADHVDLVVWGWIRDLLLNPEALRQNLEAQQAEQEQANKPLQDRLAVIDDLLSKNRRQLEKLLDLYLSGDFDKEILTERKTRLETTIAALEKERADLVTTLEATTLTDDQILTIEDFAKEVAGGLEEAEESFEDRQHIVDLLDVQVTLAIEEGQRVAYVRCLVDEAELSIKSISSHTCGRPGAGWARSLPRGVGASRPH